MFLAVVLGVVTLRVDHLVVLAKEAIDQLLVVGSDTLEGEFFCLAELINHLLVHLEVRCSVFAFVLELDIAQTSEGEQLRHVERGVDQNALVAMLHLGIESTHAGADDEVRLLLFNVLAQEGDCLLGTGRDVGTQHSDILFVKIVAEVRGGAS